MPAKKNSALITRHETKAERNDRVAREEAMQPKTALTVKPPDVLKGNTLAIKRWKRLIELYAEVDGVLVTSFDEDLLATYCLLYQELHEDLPNVYALALKTYERLEKRLQRVEDDDLLLQLTKELTKVLKEIKGIDARRDVKRSLALKHAQSSYLTPRSRAGVAPPEKEDEDEGDEMEAMLK